MTPRVRKYAFIALSVLTVTVIFDRQSANKNTELVAAVVRAAPVSDISQPGVLSSSASFPTQVGTVQTLTARDEYKDQAKNLFVSLSYGAKASAAMAVTTAQQAQLQAAQPVAVPSAPALPFAVIGKQKSGSSWEVYLAKADQTFVVREGETVAAAYQIISIKPPAMVLRYLPLNQPQTLMIGAPFDD